MIFVLGISGIKSGFEREIFDADIRDAAGPIKRGDCSATESLLNGGGNRRINRHEAAFDRFHHAIPRDVARARLPTATFATTEVGGAELSDPVGGAGAFDADMVAGLQRGSVLNAQAGRTNGNNFISNLPWLAGCLIIPAKNPNQRATIQTGGNERGVTHALAAQDNACVGDNQSAENFVTPFQEENRATQAVRVERQAGDMINRLLDVDGFIAFEWSDNNADRRDRNLLFVGGVSSGGKVGEIGLGAGGGEQQDGHDAGRNAPGASQQPTANHGECVHGSFPVMRSNFVEWAICFPFASTVKPAPRP